MYSNWNSEIADNKKVSDILKKDTQTNQDVFDILHMDRWLEDYWTWELFGHIMYSNRLFTRSHSSNLFEPFSRRNTPYVTQEVIWRITGELNAKHLTKSILDDSLPYENKALGKYNYWLLPAWREWNARLLWDIRYHDAADNLLEAWIYDSNANMRAACFKALWQIKKLDLSKLKKMCKRLLVEKELWVQFNIAEALWKAWDINILPDILNIIEEFAYNIDSNDKNDITFLLTFEYLLVAVFKIDDNTGRQLIKKLLFLNWYEVQHFAKKALFTSGTGMTMRKEPERNIEFPSVSEIKKYS